MIRTLTLTEYETKKGCELSAKEKDALLAFGSKLVVAPAMGQEGKYDITPSSWVGAINLGTLAIEVRPKMPVSSVLFLLSYAMNKVEWHNSNFDFAEESAIFEGIVPGFAGQVKKALYRGVLQGYQTEEAALTTLRGRLRFDDQIKTRFGRFPPVEVRYDEFTEDIEENRLIKAALSKLGRMRIRSEAARKQLSAYNLLLQSVSLLEYKPERLPEIIYTRLNERYRSAVELAKLILRASSFELNHGQVSATSFLVDMNAVFENFVVTALREELGINERAFPQGAAGKSLTLDTAAAVNLKPDISWWQDGHCMFVGDIKYKVVNVAGIKHADLYQLLAYTIATDLPKGLLIYAAGDDVPVEHTVVYLGKELVVRTLDLSGSPNEILGQIRQMAYIIRQQRNTQHQ